MIENYKPIKAVNYVEEKTQLDRIEKKLDSILLKLEEKELSISLNMETIKQVNADLDKRYNERLKRCGLI